MLGRTIAHYRILEPLGEGGMGVVYLAEDLRLGRRVAVKALPESLAKRSRERERLAVEARAVARLSHPSIAAVYSLEQDGDDLFIVSEYVPGLTLRAVLRDGPMPAERLAPLAQETASALAAAHAQGVVHRDLKPENIIVSDAGHVKLLDFGLARLSDEDLDLTRSRLTAAGTVVGTLAYMSPEQLRGAEVDQRSDIFSFGVVLYEALGGTHPFERSSAASTIATISSADRAPSLSVKGGVARALAQIAQRCLEKDPAARYQASVELEADLEAVARGGLPLVRERPAAEGAGSREGRFTARWWWRTHQIQVGAVYLASLIPLWAVRQFVGDARGIVVFFVGLGGAVVASALRWHLAFTSRVHPASLVTEMKRTQGWIAALDLVMAAAMLAGAALIARDHNWWAALLIGGAVGVIVASRVIEPATTRAAFRRRPGRAAGGPKSGGGRTPR